jgi:tight adherence protein B
MGALLGLLLGLGLLLIWSSRTGVPGPERAGRARSARAWPARRAELLRQAGVDGVSSGQLAAIQIGAGMVAALIGVVASGTVSIALCFGIFGLLSPTALVRRLRRRRMVDLRELWPEAVDNLMSAIRAGMSLPEAVAALGQRGPEQLRPAFVRFGDDYRATGRFMESLDRLKERLSDPVGDRVCETLRVARQVGGSDLGTVLRILSAFLRDDARTRAELETRQGWTVNAARLAVAAPWLILLLLASQAGTLDAYDSTAGVLLLAVGAGVCAVAYQLMVRIGRLPEERRVLR